MTVYKVDPRYVSRQCVLLARPSDRRAANLAFLLENLRYGEQAAGRRKMRSNVGASNR